MTGEEAISVARLARHVDDMAKEMVTQDLLKAEMGRVEAALNAHIDYTRMAALAEAKRLDAIREVDATAVKVANDRAIEQALLLAKQVELVATRLEERVTATAKAAAETQAQLFAPLATKLQRVEDKQNEDRGAAKYTDPMLTDLMKEMKEVITFLSEGKGKGQGATALWGYIIGAVGLISAILAIASRYVK